MKSLYSDLDLNILKLIGTHIFSSSDFSAFLQQFVDISHKKLGHKGQGGKSYCKILSTKVLLVLPTYFFHAGTVRGNSAKAKYTFYFDCIIKMIDLVHHANLYISFFNFPYLKILFNP